MLLPDVNVLIYAHREDAPEHDRYADWLEDLVGGREPFALSELVLSAFLRLVTNRRIFEPATPMDVALDFCQRLTRWPSAVIVRPSERHWQIFVDLIRGADIRGAMVTDAYLAALAIEHGCEFVSTDSDFARFEGLRWRHPLAASG
ncbi:MAG: type II toxin-antitoxin system VapC family toxin [bacterium]|nr:type II toxin-antitoxin system VapC family toxin [bacterium]